MTYLRLVTLNWLALLVGLALLSCEVRQAQAGGFYLDASVGVLAGAPETTLPDGDWHQKGLPHTISTTSLAWRIGAGYHFNERWSIQAHYLKPTKPDAISALHVDDRYYNPKTSTCLVNCDRIASLRATDTKYVVDVSVTRTFHTAYADPFLRIGGGVLFHTLTIHGYQNHAGTVPLMLIGAGACKGILCLDMTYYQVAGPPSTADYGYAISNNMFVALIGFKIPIGG